MFHEDPARPHTTLGLFKSMRAETYVNSCQEFPCPMGFDRLLAPSTNPIVAGSPPYPPCEGKRRQLCAGGKRRQLLEDIRRSTSWKDSRIQRNDIPSFEKYCYHKVEIPREMAMISSCAWPELSRPVQIIYCIAVAGQIDYLCLL